MLHFYNNSKMLTQQQTTNTKDLHFSLSRHQLNI